MRARARAAGRFFYLTDEALCYRNQPPSAEHGLADGGVEKRIPLGSVLNVRVHSKLKFEFELVCTSRVFRLRAPSAQALAVWVTTISAEWMQLQHRNTQRAVAGAVAAVQGHHVAPVSAHRVGNANAQSD